MRARVRARVRASSSFVFGATFTFLILFPFWEQVSAKLWLREVNAIISLWRRALQSFQIHRAWSR